MRGDSMTGEEFAYKRMMCNKAIKTACIELNLKVPEVYYLQLDNIRLYDQEGEVVSYDYRDIGHDIKTIRYIPKEYVIYININLFLNEINMLVKCYQTVRQMYQLREIYNKRHSLKLNESSTTVNLWQYGYFECNNKATKITPVQADMMAFSVVMMKKQHAILIDFKDNDYFGYDALLKSMRKTFLNG